MDIELTIDALRSMAQQRGLELSDDELQRLLPGANRSKKQAVELRDVVAAEDEPAVTFAASKAPQK